MTVRIAVIPAHLILSLSPQEFEMKRSIGHLRLGAAVAILAAAVPLEVVSEIQGSDRTPPLSFQQARETERLEVRGPGKKKKRGNYDPHAVPKHRIPRRPSNPR